VRSVPGLGVTVNLSARQLQQADLVDHVGAALRASGLDPRALRFDATEAALEQCGETGVEALRRLKALGVGLTLDDFGVGTTSLRNLRRLPLDAVRLDPALVHGTPTDADRVALTAAIIRVAHALRLQVIAEGVETEEQLAFLVAQRCDRVQGYLLGPPLPPAELGELLASRGHRMARSTGPTRGSSP
jgi:EAL domain-containing protein (putative c-di-GMP-specific phosphodiesterase class I)